MDWSVNEKNGKVTVSVTRSNDGLGLYRAYAVGPSGARCLLGTLTPQGTCLILRRTLGVDTLKYRGCYPVTTVTADLAHPFSAPLPPLPGWREAPENLPFPDHILRRAYAAGPRAYYQTAKTGFSLAYPCRENAPFPLPALFCFAQAICVCDRRLWRFSFDGEGHPLLDV